MRRIILQINNLQIYFLASGPADLVISYCQKKNLNGLDKQAVFLDTRASLAFVAINTIDYA
jgi:hypothetical protein